MPNILIVTVDLSVDINGYTSESKGILPIGTRLQWFMVLCISTHCVGNCTLLIRMLSDCENPGGYICFSSFLRLAKVHSYVPFLAGLLSLLNPLEHVQHC